MRVSTESVACLVNYFGCVSWLLLRYLVQKFSLLLMLFLGGL